MKCADTRTQTAYTGCSTEHVAHTLTSNRGPHCTRCKGLDFFSHHINPPLITGIQLKHPRPHQHGPARLGVSMRFCEYARACKIWSMRFCEHARACKSGVSMRFCEYARACKIWSMRICEHACACKIWSMRFCEYARACKIWSMRFCEYARACKSGVSMRFCEYARVCKSWSMRFCEYARACKSWSEHALL